MTLLCDIGNTNIVLCTYSGIEYGKPFRLYTDRKKSGDEYYVILTSLFEDNGVDISKINKVVISSVVPFVTRTISKNMERIFSLKPILITLDSPSGLVGNSIPSELGTDILSNLSYAHYYKKNKNVIVVDFGTALTLSAVNRSGEVVGVSILPGLITSVNALYGSTAQLPQVELKLPERVLNRTSESAICSGVMLGAAGSVEKLITEAKKELKDEDAYVIATGGLSSTISSIIISFNEVDTLLTIKGLGYISTLII